MKVLVYDRTCRWLGQAWRAGARLYGWQGRLDAVYPAATWPDALAWLAARPEPIDELQYWGHGNWGVVRLGDTALDEDALVPGHAYHPGIEALRERLAPGALVWLRTCETFGARRGQAFAMRLADTLGARVAGHTHVIGFHQSGLHGLLPGARPAWRADEGLAEGTPEAPVRARRSHPWAPCTITCLDGAVPTAWFTA